MEQLNITKKKIEEKLGNKLLKEFSDFKEEENR